MWAVVGEYEPYPIRICAGAPEMLAVAGFASDEPTVHTMPTAASTTSTARPSIGSLLWGATTDRTTADELRGFDAHDLELDRSGRRRHLDHIALLVSQHGPADGRLV